MWVFQSGEPQGRRNSASKSLSQQQEEVGEQEGCEEMMGHQRGWAQPEGPWQGGEAGLYTAAYYS